MKDSTLDESTQLLSPNDNNSQIIMIRKMKLLISNDNGNSLDKVREAQRLLSFIESIFKSSSTGETFLYLLDRGATTAWLLQVNLEIPGPSAYRALKRLRVMGLVTPEWRIPNRRLRSRKPGHAKGGPRAMVWALLDASKEDVARAVRDHRRALSPNYRVAEEFVQYLLEDCIMEDITYKRILQYGLERLDMSKQRVRDVSQMAANILSEQGIKVWRSN